MGPDNLIMETVEDVTESLMRIPKMVQNMEKNAVVLAQDGLKLHPDTIRSMGYNASRMTPTLSPSFYLIVIVVLLVILIFI